MVSKDMTRCRSCAVELTKDNWYESHKKKGNHLCKSCWGDYCKRYFAKTPRPIEADDACIKCNHKLTEENWLMGNRRRHMGICALCYNKRANSYYRTNRSVRLPYIREYNKIHRHKLKIATLLRYSGTDPPRCADPFGIHKEPFTILDALTIDHINNDGAKDRSQLHGGKRGGVRFYEILKKNGYPAGYQVLCANCNLIKEMKYQRRI